MAEKAFRACYKDLMKGITDPNDVAASLYGEGLLTPNERDQVMQATQTIDQKNQHLLRCLEARIAGDSEAFDKLVEIFENEDAYASLAKKLKEKRGGEWEGFVLPWSNDTHTHTHLSPSSPAQGKSAATVESTCKRGLYMYVH